MNVGSLCSGYGGLDLALGLPVAWHVEHDAAPSKILAERFPGVPNHGDLTAVNWAELEPVDVLTAGYPCQPFSHAGKRKGTNDARHLWPYVAHAVRVLRPRLVFLENVAGHLSLGFGDVLGDLAHLGYDARWCCVRASDVGAPHQRKRLFIVASDAGRAGAWGDAGAVSGEVQGWAGLDVRSAGDDRATAADADEPGPQGPQPAGRHDLPAGRGGATAPDAAHDGLHGTDAARRRGTRPQDGGVVAWGDYEPAIRRWEHLTRPVPSPVDDRGRLAPAFVEWMQGLPAGWVTDIDISRNAQLKALGNGVVPQQAAHAWRLLTSTHLRSQAA